MKHSITLVTLLAAGALFATSCKSPKRSSGITITVTNPSSFSRTDQPVIIDAKDLQKKYPDLDITKAVIYSGDSTIPSQVNDINADGKPDQLVFLANLGPQQKKVFTLRKLAKGEKPPIYKRRTQAVLAHKVGGHWKDHKYIGGTFKNFTSMKVPKESTDHSFYTRIEGPGWESDKVGYRFYLDWRNAIDIFGKKVDTMALQNVGLDGYSSYHKDAPWGRDIFEVGRSLGLGSIAMWKDNKVNMVSKTDSVTSRIAFSGPVESMIETKYYGWKVDNKKYDLRSRLSIFGGSRLTKHSLVLKGDTTLLCTGLAKAPGIPLLTQQNPKGWTYLASWGNQSLASASDSLGIAVLVKSKNLVKITADSLSQIAVLKPKDNTLKYYLLAAWDQEPGGIKTKAQFLQYLNKELQILNTPVKVEF